MKFLTIFILVIASVVKSEIPANFPRCHNADSECMKNAANEVVKKHYSGLRDINLLSFDPLRIKSLTIERNPASPVNIELKLKNAELIGLKNMKITSFTGLTADFSGHTVLEAIVPEIRMKGTYNLNGRILLLPIVGEGNCEITLKNVILKSSSEVKPIEKNGKVYGTLQNVKLDQEPSFVHFQLDNLFNGDKSLGDNMNKIINESWKEVFGELKPSLTEGLALIVKQILNNVMEKYPYADYFL